MRIARFGPAVALVILAGSGCHHLSPDDRAAARGLALSRNGQSDYTVILPTAPTAIDQFAAVELTNVLLQATGAAIPVASADRAPAGGKKIFIGLCPAAHSRLGATPLDGLEDQEHIVRTAGGDLHLFGQGPHGNLYAVYDFLETEVGCRWFSAFHAPHVPRTDALWIPPADRRRRPAFPNRYLGAYNFLLRPEAGLFLYRNRLNLGPARIAGGVTGVVDAARLVEPGVHTLFAYVPPRETPRHGINPPMAYLKHKRYFETHPEFFSMNTNSQRVETMQLCLGNPELRRTLTDNLLQHIRLEGGRGIFTVDANDVPGHFCHCPACRALTERYGSIGGPLYDYLLELSPLLQRDFPDVSVKFLAYRKEQSQKPPKIQRLPDNLIVVFAPIDDNFAADWSHPTNLETYRDLEAWCRIARHVWVWYYSNPYSTPALVLGNTGRLVTDIRLMKQAGCTGMFFEHDVGVMEGTGFSELQTWLMVKLWQDPGLDEQALIDEFMLLQYGAAAPVMRRYLDELEQLRASLPHAVPWNPTFHQFHYLTPDRLIRWEGDFDEMLARTAGDDARQDNLRLVRINLDRAVLLKWAQVKPLVDASFPSFAGIDQRIVDGFAVARRTRCSPAWASYMDARIQRATKDIEELRLFAEVVAKPLPGAFAALPESRVRRTVPRRGRTDRLADPAAAFGVTTEMPLKNVSAEQVLSFGFYDGYSRKFVSNRVLKKSDIQAEGYHLYALGTVALTPDCLIWLDGSWGITGKLDAFYEPGVHNRWEVYLSLKFEGPSFSDTPAPGENRVRCDQIVLIKVDPETLPH